LPVDGAPDRFRKVVQIARLELQGSDLLNRRNVKVWSRRDRTKLKITRRFDRKSTLRLACERAACQSDWSPALQRTGCCTHRPVAEQLGFRWTDAPVRDRHRVFCVLFKFAPVEYSILPLRSRADVASCRAARVRSSDGAHVPKGFLTPATDPSGSTSANLPLPDLSPI
jgi:hypothetical protein